MKARDSFYSVEKRHTWVVATGRGSMRRDLLILFLSLLLASCSTKKAGKAPDVSTIAGKVSVRGTEFVRILILAAEDGRSYLLESGRLKEELENLAGMRLALVGKLAGRELEGLPVFEVSSYRLLATPMGEVPLVGVVGLEGGRCILAGEEGSWILEGDLARILSDFVGTKVWVVGRRKYGDRIEVTGYGVIKSVTP